MAHPNKNKYNASGVWYDMARDEELLAAPSSRERRIFKREWQFFPSQHEFECYLALREKFPKESIKIHHSICIRPESSAFKGISWVVDFLAIDDKGEYLIEAKGVTTRDFVLKASLLEYLYPEKWKKLLIVYPKGKLQKIPAIRRHKGLEKKSINLWKLRRILDESSLSDFLHSLS